MISCSQKVSNALLKVQQEISNPKDTEENPFCGSTYASLPQILNMVRPLLNKNDLVLIQNTGTCEDGIPYVQTKFIHSSGECIESDKLMLVPDKGGKKKGVQEIGSSITYGRRYQLTAMLGIMNEKDDDGNSSNTQGQPQKQNNSQNNSPKKAPKTSQTSGKKPKTGKKQSKTAQKNGDAETSSVVEGEARRWKESAKKHPEIKKVCDALNNTGLEICEANINAQAEEMNTKKQLTDNEYNKVQVALGKAPG